MVLTFFFKRENVEQQRQQSPFVLTDLPDRSESDDAFDIEETENFLAEQANLRKEQEENQKKLKSMTKALVLDPAENEAQIDEEISRKELSKNLSSSVPDSLLFSGQSSPVNA